MSFQDPSDPASDGISSTSFGEMGADFTTGDEHGYTGTNEPLPAGWYQAMITETEFKATKDNTGRRLNLTWEVIDGTHKGRKIFTGLNLVNKNPKAAEIARKELNTICAASGFAKGHTLRDSTELHNAPIWIQVKVQPATAEYPAKNEVNGYHPWTNPDPVTGGPIRQKPQAAPAAATPGPGPAAAAQAAPAGRPATNTGPGRPAGAPQGRPAGLATQAPPAGEDPAYKPAGGVPW